MAIQNSLNITDSGIIAADGAGVFTGRTLTGTSDFIDIANGTGVSGNPTASIATNFEETGMHGWNGSILETADVSISSDGASITLSVEQSGGGDLTVVFSDGYYDWDTTPADTVTLTAGSDSSPTLNYVYFLQSTKTLTKSTSGWPATEHAPIANVLCQSAATLQTKLAYKNHVSTNDVLNTSSNGHVSDLNFWVRKQQAGWISGVDQTYTITTNGGSSDNVILTTALGSILQLHPHTFPAFSGTPDIYVINDSVTPYTIVTDLNSLLTDSTGASMSGRYFSLVIWGCVSEDTGECKLFCNLPSGSYTTQASLEADDSAYSTYTIPTAFKGSGFLISEWKLRHQTADSGTWTSIDEIDLRGFIPPNIAGGGAGSQSTEFADDVFRIFDDGDDTKKIAFQASGITTATTRTFTVPNASGTLALASSLSTNGIAYASDGNTISSSAAATNGQILIGRTGLSPALGTITGGTGLTTTNASGSITINLDVPVDETLGGTGISSYTTGDIIYASGLNTLSKLAIGSANEVLTVAGGVPSWDPVADDIVQSVVTDSGTATPASNAFSIVGGTGISTSGATSVVTVTLDTPVDETLGGTGQTTYTTGDVLYASASNTLSKLAVGSNGQVLTLATGVPSWATPSAGSGTGWVFLDSATASTSTSLDFTSSIDSTYNVYAFVAEDIVHDSALHRYLYLRTSSDGGSTFDSGSTDYVWEAYKGNLNYGQDSFIRLTYDTISNNKSLSGTFFLYNPSDSVRTQFTGQTSIDSPGQNNGSSTAGTRMSAGVVNAVRFFTSSGNILSGTIRLYGVCTTS
jgi:hypothetical protein